MQSKGIGALLFASMLYGFFGIYARYIGSQFDVFTQNWIRNTFVISLTTLLIILFKQKWKKVKKKDAPWIIGWVICDILFVISFFIVFNNLSIGVTLFLLYSGITITGYVIGTFLLKEKLTRIKLAAIIISIFGLLLIYSGQISSTQIAMLMLGFASGIVGGLWFILPKFISKTYPKLQLITFDAIGILVVNLLLSQLYQHNVPPFTLSAAWISIFLYGITQITADFSMIYGFKLVEAQIGSLILPLEIVFGIVYAYFFFQETLSLITLIGGSFILTGAILPNIPQKLWRSCFLYLTVKTTKL